MVAITRFTTLLFDCYGTLIDWERGILSELRPWTARHRLTVDDDTLLEMFGRTEAQCEAETPTTRYSEILADVLVALAAQLGVALEPDEAEVFGRSVERWPAFPDSPAALQYLKKYYNLAVLSNVDHASFAKSNEKLAVAFDAVFTAEDIGSYKPAARNFQYALTRLNRDFGVEREDVLHTAQSLFHDIAPAKSIGLATMWVNRRKGLSGWGATPPPSDQAVQPDFEVASLHELAVLHRSTISQDNDRR